MKNKFFQKVLILLSLLLGAILGVVALSNTDAIFAAENEPATEASIEVKDFTYQYSDTKILTRAHCLDHDDTDELDFINVKNATGDWYINIYNVEGGNGSLYRTIPDDGISIKGFYAGTYCVSLHQEGKAVVSTTFVVSPSEEEISVDSIKFYGNNYASSYGSLVELEDYNKTEDSSVLFILLI